MHLFGDHHLGFNGAERLVCIGFKIDVMGDIYVRQPGMAINVADCAAYDYEANRRPRRCMAALDSDSTPLLPNALATQPQTN